MGPDLVGFRSRECFQHPFFLVILQDGLCLGFIGLQSLDHRLWFVVLTLNQRFSCQVIDAHSLGRVEFNVVHSATGRMDPASSKALFNDLKGHVEVYHCVYLVNSIQGFCLWKCPRKTGCGPASPATAVYQQKVQESVVVQSVRLDVSTRVQYLSEL